MKARFALAAIAAACLSTVAVAQMGPGMDHRGMGPGMGPGMSGAPGMGAGTAGGHEGCAMMGPGRMGGQAMGRGMMGGHGMGGGMMGGGMMGGGMMGGAGMMGMPDAAALDKLNLSDDQRGKLTEIRRDMQRKRHALMGSMHEVRWQAEDAARAPEFDEAAARRNFEAMAGIHKQMFESHLDARKRVDAVLTKEQREELRKAARPAAPGPR